MRLFFVPKEEIEPCLHSKRGDFYPTDGNVSVFVTYRTCNDNDKDNEHVS